MGMGIGIGMGMGISAQSQEPVGYGNNESRISASHQFLVASFTHTHI